MKSCSFGSDFIFGFVIWVSICSCAIFTRFFCAKLGFRAHNEAWFVKAFVQGSTFSVNQITIQKQQIAQKLLKNIYQPKYFLLEKI